MAFNSAIGLKELNRKDKMIPFHMLNNSGMLMPYQTESIHQYIMLFDMVWVVFLNMDTNGALGSSLVTIVVYNLPLPTSGQVSGAEMC